jgi:hypothetical protein
VALTDSIIVSLLSFFLPSNTLPVNIHGTDGTSAATQLGPVLADLRLHLTRQTLLITVPWSPPRPGRGHVGGAVLQALRTSLLQTLMVGAREKRRHCSFTSPLLFFHLRDALSPLRLDIFDVLEFFSPSLWPLSIEIVANATTGSAAWIQCREVLRV